MPTLTITKGLPGSGKSHWAKQQVKNSEGKIKRVNKDDLRAMVDAGVWSREMEKEIIKIERTLAGALLAQGYDVIVDNTHLQGDHEAHYQELAELAGYFFDVKDFTDVPLEVCIARDQARPNPVGKKAIMRMYNAALRGKSVQAYVPPVYNDDLPYCIIVDIDGTLAHGTGRNMYDFAMVYTDAADIAVGEVVTRYATNGPDGLPDTYIIVVSGRGKECEAETKQWLEDNGIYYDELYMREAGDVRDDTIVKKEIYEESIKPRYNVRFVLDDRNKVVKMWRDEGLKVLQVQDGPF